ncbi:MAG: S8 family serine peptidase [Proteobacteria bacterium]|nr:S8 family serine peptidase [Pseudomonadota bacterium]
MEIAQPNYIYRISAVPNDTYYTTLWGLHNTGQTVSLLLEGAISTDNPGTSGSDINIEPIWDKVTDCSSVVVAILDTGVNYNHSDLNSNMWNGGTSYPNHGYDFVNSDTNPMDDNGHGTHLAGIIGAVGNNGKYGTGVCWKASMMAIKALDDTGVGYTSQIVQGIDFAINNGAKVINMSFGGSANDAAIAAEITAAEQAGVLVVAAAGNDGVDIDSTTKTYPCAYTNSNIICVAALDQADILANFSNYGATSVDVGAPGLNIYSSWFGDVITDDFSIPWTLTGTIGTWGYSYITVYGNQVNLLTSPSNWSVSGANKYVSNSNKGIWRNFSIDSSSSYIALAFYASVDVDSPDFFKIYYNTGLNPIGGSGLVDSISQKVLSYPITSFDSYQYLLPNCIGQSNCSIGFQLTSTGSSNPRSGVAIGYFNIYEVKNPTTYYKIEHGTSMATPYVTGLAAILMAYNPGYTYSNVRNAIINGGRSVSALSQKTTSGNSIDGWGAITYINAPIGITATVK